MLTKFKPAMLKKLDLSLILGAASTVIFYAIVLRPSMHHTLIQRYTTEHPVDYVIVAMFLWGIADIVLKTFAFPRESFALREEWLPPRNGREPVAHAHEMLKAIQAKPLWLTESKIGQRIAQALGYVIENGSAEDYREHLNYLSSRGEDTTHARYSLVRFIIAISPVLGFLGTVVHFGTALSGISFDEMADRLPVVVSEMGEAFNTTTVALATAMTMMFALFVCERIEHSFDGFIDRFIERELLNRFEVKHANLTPFLSMVQAANDDALHIMAATFDRQVAVWTQSMESGGVDHGAECPRSATRIPRHQERQPAAQHADSGRDPTEPPPDSHRKDTPRRRTAARRLQRDRPNAASHLARRRKADRAATVPQRQPPRTAPNRPDRRCPARPHRRDPSANNPPPPR